MATAIRTDDPELDALTADLARLSPSWRYGVRLLVSAVLSGRLTRQEGTELISELVWKLDNC